MSKIRANEVLDFWQAAGPSAWWQKNSKFDAEIKMRFDRLHQQAATGILDEWHNEPASCLALVIILDQFSRNLHRGSDRAFAQDAAALKLAKYAVENGFDRNQPQALYDFFHLPFMHSENLEDQKACVELICVSGNQGSIKAAIEHRDIITRFGRFPHRNDVLGRQNSPEEQAFLDGGGFSG